MLWAARAFTESSKCGWFVANTSANLSLSVPARGPRLSHGSEHAADSPVLAWAIDRPQHATCNMQRTTRNCNNTAGCTRPPSGRNEDVFDEPREGQDDRPSMVFRVLPVPSMV